MFFLLLINTKLNKTNANKPNKQYGVITLELLMFCTYCKRFLLCWEANCIKCGHLSV